MQERQTSIWPIFKSLKVWGTSKLTLETVTKDNEQLLLTTSINHIKLLMKLFCCPIQMQSIIINTWDIWKRCWRKGNFHTLKRTAEFKYDRKYVSEHLMLTMGLNLALVQPRLLGPFVFYIYILCIYMPEIIISTENKHTNGILWFFFYPFPINSYLVITPRSMSYYTGRL